MAFLGGNDLKVYLRLNKIILNETDRNIFDDSRVEQAAYSLALGSEVYRTDNKDRKIELLDSKNRTVEINPGQFTLLLTDEIVHVPDDKLAFISIKAKQKLKGLINVSGFHVDPGFKGRLLFSVYNAGPSTITLETKKPYFLIWFSDLKNSLSTNELYNSIANNHQGQNSIPLDYVDALKSGEITSPNLLLQQINENKREIKAVETSRTLKNEKLFWIFSTILALVTSFNFIYWNRNAEYKNGYSDAIKDSELIKLIEKGETYTIDSLNLIKIDSLIIKRMEKSGVKQK